MCPSEKESSLFMHIGKLIFSPGTKQGKAPETLPQQLYIVSDDEIKPRDYSRYSNKYYNCVMKVKSVDKSRNLLIHENDNSSCPLSENKKVISSTDKSITPYSWIQESFIKAYVKAFIEGHPIKEVDLEMTNMTVFPGAMDNDQSIREEIDINTRPDGSVIIRQSKTYSRENVISLLKKYEPDAPNKIAQFVSENL